MLNTYSREIVKPPLRHFLGWMILFGFVILNLKKSLYDALLAPLVLKLFEADMVHAKTFYNDQFWVSHFSAELEVRSEYLFLE